MGELLTKFISLLDDETEDKVTLASLMEEEDRVDWEILVEAMDLMMMVDQFTMSLVHDAILTLRKCYQVMSIIFVAIQI